MKSAVYVDLILILSGALVVSIMLSIGTIEALSNPNQKDTNHTKHNHSHHTVLHNHISRKVFDRACAASKDTIDEIVACMTSNEQLVKSVNPESATGCFKESFGTDFDPKDFHKHKDLVCNNRDKFEEMTACIYRKTMESTSSKEMEKFMESLVDVGLCIINALDG